MRKVILFMHLSLDGYCATKDGDLSWIPYNSEFEKFGEKIVKSTGVALYGKNTFEVMKQFRDIRQDTSASKHDLEHAEWIENIEKIVFSTKLKEENWNNTRIISENIFEEVTKLKEAEGGNLVIFGSPTLAISLMKLDLIDEFQFTISPIVLGEGKTFLRNIDTQIKLELLKTENIEGGVIAIRYRIVR